MDRGRTGRGVARRMAFVGLALAAATAVPVERASPLAPGAPAAVAQGLPVSIEAGGSREVLSGDNEAWEDYWIRATVRPAAGSYAYGGVRHTRRFGEEDQQLEVGAGLPLAPAWSLALDATWSPTRNVLPIWGASGRVTHRFNADWSAFIGGGRQSWESNGVTRQHVGANRHFGRARIGYTLALHQVDTGGNGIRHHLDGSLSYDDRGSTLTLGLGVGRDATMVAARDIRSVSYESAGISGTHWIGRTTGIGYHFGVYRYGEFYTRTASSVGVRHRF